MQEIIHMGVPIWETSPLKIWKGKTGENGWLRGRWKKRLTLQQMTWRMIVRKRNPRWYCRGGEEGGDGEEGEGGEGDGVEGEEEGGEVEEEAEDVEEAVEDVDEGEEQTGSCILCHLTQQTEMQVCTYMYMYTQIK